jgi:hypothetical protein
VARLARGPGKPPCNTPDVACRHRRAAWSSKAFPGLGALGVTRPGPGLSTTITYDDLTGQRKAQKGQKIVKTPESGWKPDLLFAASLSAEM